MGERTIHVRLKLDQRAKHSCKLWLGEVCGGLWDLALAVGRNGVIVRRWCGGGAVGCALGGHWGVGKSMGRRGESWAFWRRNAASRGGLGLGRRVRGRKAWLAKALLWANAPGGRSSKRCRLCLCCARDWVTALSSDPKAATPPDSAQTASLGGISWMMDLQRFLPIETVARGSWGSLGSWAGLPDPAEFLVALFTLATVIDRDETVTKGVEGVGRVGTGCQTLRNFSWCCSQ